MNRSALLALLAALLAPLLWAQPPARPPQERLAQWQRNQHLIQTLVHSGLTLAGEDDSLKKADHCATVAEQMVQSVRQTLAARDAARTYELCYHLFDVLEHGVAANLRQAHDGVLPGSSLDRKLQAVQKRTADLVRPLEAELRRGTNGTAEPEWEQARQAVRAGRARVEDALDGR